MISKRDIDQRIGKLEKENERLKAQNADMQKKFDDLDFRCRDLMKKYNELIGEINLRYYELLPEERYEAEAEKRFLIKTGEILDLSEPKTLNEKIQWLKFHDRDPIKTKLADKLSVRRWVAETIGSEYLTESYGDWNCFDAIDMDRLPGKFVLKPSHGSGMVILVDDKSRMDTDRIRKTVNRWLTVNYAYRGLEMQYRDIKPRVLAEKHIGQSGKDFQDYKFWCFNGKVAFIHVIDTVGGSSVSSGIYDRNWRRTPFQREDETDALHERPTLLKKMITLSEKLSENFKFVRVDLYTIRKKEIKFGEMTFSPANGERIWVPKEYDRKLGDLLVL